MHLSIITINYNNAAGLQLTLQSIEQQTIWVKDKAEVEHILIDGGSTDGSSDLIRQYAERVAYNVQWVSEKDKGIYNAMNKGIIRAHGDYCQFLNSGDRLADKEVTEKMLNALKEHKYPDILYGNMRKVFADGRTYNDRGPAYTDVTLKIFYHGCLNHSPAYIRRQLFDTYGLYDESLKICSDWKFYVQSIILGTARVKHTNLLVTIFDMGGISETRRDILEEERKRLLKEMIPQGILPDYDRYHDIMFMSDRLRKHHLWGLVWFVERVLFKLEKWHILKP